MFTSMTSFGIFMLLHSTLAATFYDTNEGAATPQTPTLTNTVTITVTRIAESDIQKVTASDAVTFSNPTSAPQPSTPIYGVVPGPSALTSTNRTMATSFDWRRRSTTGNATSESTMLTFSAASPEAVSTGEADMHVQTQPFPLEPTASPSYNNASLSARALDATMLHSTTTADVDAVAWAGVGGTIQRMKRWKNEESSAGKKGGF